MLRTTNKSVCLFLCISILAGCSSPQVFNPNPYKEASLAERKKVYQEQKIENNSILSWRRYSVNGTSYSPEKFSGLFTASKPAVSPGGAV